MKKWKGLWKSWGDIWVSLQHSRYIPIAYVEQIYDYVHIKKKQVPHCFLSCMGQEAFHKSLSILRETGVFIYTILNQLQYLIILKRFLVTEARWSCF